MPGQDIAVQPNAKKKIESKKLHGNCQRQHNPRKQREFRGSADWML